MLLTDVTAPAPNIPLTVLAQAAGCAELPAYKSPKSVALPAEAIVI